MHESDPPATWHSRQKQRQHLLRALCGSGIAPIFIWGASTTGKRSVLSSALNAVAPTATVNYVDCVRAHGDRALYSSIDKDIATLDLLVPCIHARLNGNNHYILVFLRAERLASAPFTEDAPRILFRLPYMLCSPRYFRVIFVSRWPWSRFRDSIVPDVREPLCIHFPTYTENEAVTAVVKMTSSSLPPNLPAPGLKDQNEALHLYPGFVASVVNVLHRYTTNLRELSRVCSRLYPAYLTPLVHDSSIQRAALWNRISADVTNAVRMLYTREFVTAAEHLDAELATSCCGGHARQDDRVLSSSHSATERARQTGSTLENMATISTELCKVSRLLLISAFLASYNPPSTDLHFFTSQVARRRPQPRGNSRTGNRKLTPKSGFLAQNASPLNRILAIYDAMQGLVREPQSDAITEFGESGNSSNALLNLSTLVDLNLLGRDGTGDLLREPKYRCNVTLETALLVAKSVDISLYEYLNDG